MAHIRKRKLKHGIAHEVYFCIDGQPHSKYFPPEIPFQAVKDYAAKIEHNKAFARAGVELPKAAISLSSLTREYTKGRAAEIDPWREGIAMRHLVRLVGDIEAARVSAEVIHRFRDAHLAERLPSGADFLTEQRIKRGVNHDLRHIRIVFRWAYRRGLIPSHPFDRVEFFKAVGNRPDSLTREELNRMRLSLSKPDRMIFHLLRFTGLRIGEACALRSTDVDLRRGLIRLTHTKNREQIDIPLDRRLARIWMWTGYLEKAGPLITIKPDTVARHFRAAMTKAGIDKQMPTHIFRHTAGRRIIERYFDTGNAQEIARKFLRHKTRAMTDHYAKVYTEDIGRAMNEVDL